MRYKTLIVMIFAFVVRFTLQKRMEQNDLVKVKTPENFILNTTKAQVRKFLNSGRTILKFDVFRANYFLISSKSLEANPPMASMTYKNLARSPTRSSSQFYGKK